MQQILFLLFSQVGERSILEGPPVIFYKRSTFESGTTRHFFTSFSPDMLKNRTYFFGTLLLCPCLFRPSDNMWPSRPADAPPCVHFSTVISPSWSTEQISEENCAHRGASARQEGQTSFKIVTWTKQTWTKHHNTGM